MQRLDCYKTKLKIVFFFLRKHSHLSKFIVLIVLNFIRCYFRFCFKMIFLFYFKLVVRHIGYRTMPHKNINTVKALLTDTLVSGQL